MREWESLSPEKWVAILAEKDAVLGNTAAKWLQMERRQSSSGTHREPKNIGDDPSLVASDLNALASALNAIPCEELDYDRWIAMLHATKAGCDDDPVFFEEVVQPWCARYSDNTPEMVSYKWESITTSTIGAGYVFAVARGHGWFDPDMFPDDLSREDSSGASASEEEDPGPFTAASLVGEPPDQEWVIPLWLPENETTMLNGEGGVGKTLLAQEIGTAVAIGKSIFGFPCKAMPVLAVLCEDKKGELHRRQNAINHYLDCAGDPGLEQFHLWPRVGFENYLVEYDKNGNARLTPFDQRLLDQVKGLGPGPKLVILDTLADLFGGNEIERRTVNHFIKRILGRLSKDHGATVMLLAHPSRAGVNDGSGFSGSTAWNNAVRNRLYLSKVNEKNDDDDNDERVLTRKKSNYAKAGDNEKIDLYWNAGVFKMKMPMPKDSIAAYELITEVFRAIKKAWDNNVPYSARKNADKYLGRFSSSQPGANKQDVLAAMNSLLDGGFIKHVSRTRAPRITGLKAIRDFGSEKGNAPGPEDGGTYAEVCSGVS
jgi:RecA-family ATPase